MVHIIKITYNRPFQQDGSYEEYQNTHPDLNQRVKFISAWRDGEDIGKLTSKQVPKNIKITGLRKAATLPDAFRVINGLPLVSDSLRNLIEQMDPGIHQFFPVELTLPAGRKLKTGFNVIIVTTKKKTILPEISDVSGPRYGSAYSLKSPGSKVVFSPSCLVGAHMWREIGYRGRLFISNELESAIRSKGLKFMKCWSGEVVGSQDQKRRE